MRIQKPHLFFLPFIFIASGLLAQPTITSFSPTSGPVGTSVTITGTNFSPTPSNNIVFFGAVKANVTAASGTSLTVAVPTGATYQPITVTVNGLTGYSQRPFIVTFAGGGQINSNSFGAKQDFVTDIRPNAITFSDFDGDGKSDIATPNNYSTAGFASVSVLRNISSSGIIDFAPKQDYVTGAVTYAIASGDIDGDGKPDIVSTAVVDATVSVFRNTSTSGNISFAPKIDIGTGNAPFGVVIGDIDGDGKSDIVTLNNTAQTISVLRNIGGPGNISFAPKIDFPTLIFPQGIALGDFDGDSKTDIAFTNRLSNSFSIYRNTSTSGNIALAARVDFSCGAGNEPYGISYGDLDNDSKLDLAVVYNGSTSGGVQLFRNSSVSGTLSFTLSYTPFGTGPTSDNFYAGINDINGDGKLDVALSISGTAAGTVFVYQNNSTTGTFSFGSANFFSASFAPYGIMLGDLEGDGRPDLAISEFTLEKISVFKNRCGYPNISFFSPSTAGANSTVTISGSNFIGVTSVTFGGTPAVSFNVINANGLTAVVGSGSSGDIVVTTSVGSGSASGFNFSAPPTISSFTPNIGFAGTTVTITGTNFTGTTAVSFGGMAASSYTVVNPTTISAVVGNGSTGSVSVTNSLGTGSLAGFTYAPIPVLYSFTPTSAATGTTVTISGQNFTGTTAVSFGGVAATSFTIVNANTITAVVANGATGNVTVTNAFGSTQITGFTYIPPPVISSYSPTSAGTGATVVISGSNFNNVTSVKFGTSNAASYNVINSTTINAVVGGGATGAVSVTAIGGTASLAGFIYIPPPTVTSFNPVTTGAGATVTITGTNFNGATAVTFGGIAAASFNVVNSTTITAVVGTGGTGPVFVVTPAGTGGAPGFDYATIPVINSVSPLTGPVGTTVTIGGANFGPGVSSNAVYFGSIKGNIISATANTITVTVPAGAINRPITVSSLTSSLSGTSEYSFKITFPGDPNAFDANSFAGQMNFAVGTDPKDIDLGDIDDDGKPDIVVSNYNSNFISIFRNTSVAGQLSFAARMDINVGQYVNEAVIYDINNDGKLDLALAQHNVTLTGNSILVILINNSSSGTIAFNAAQTFFTFDPFMQLVAGDLNNDGKPEIAAVCNNCAIPNGGHVVTFLNMSSGGNLAFAPTRIYFTSSAPGNTLMNGIELRDLNKDNKQDIMIGSSGSGDALINLKNNSQGLSFSTIVIGSFYGSGYFCTVPFADDLNGNGITDVVCTNNINIHTGNFNFDRQQDIALGAGVTADLNGDGKPEIVCQGTVISNTSDKISVFRNSSSPSSVLFVPPVNYAANNTYMKVVAGDLDGDGKPEIASSNMNLNNISIYRNRIAESALPSPTITSFTPTSAAQSAQVTITGTNFSQATNVSFGNVTASFFTVISPTTIIATLATGASGSVSITTPGGTASLAGFTYLSIPVPTITSFTPTSATGGGTITITGTNFTGATAISFGGTAANSFTIVNSTTITAVVGSGASGNVSVTTPAGTASLAGFIFIGPPTISSFTPTSAGTGATISITGANFTGTTAVSFGGVAATSFVVNSSTNITTVVGSGASGSVSVTTSGGTATLAGFTFILPPTISSFTPTSAGTGTTVTITGTNFTGVTAVSFGGVAAASFVVNSSTSITAIVGAGATGNVSVTTPAGTASLAGFIFIPPPIISSFTPTTGATGATITITGTNFTGATAVRFGGVTATSFVVNSSTSITAVVATGASGNVSVTTPAGTASLAGFTFIVPPTISSFTPTSGTNGTSVTIAGTNFTGVSAVTFGGVAATSFVVNSATSITAIVGIGATGNVSVTTPGGTVTAAGFTYNAVTGIGGPGSINSKELIVNPNPAKDFLIIKHPSTNKNAELDFYDILGRKVKAILPARNSRQTDVMLNYMTPGIYTIVWSDGTRVLSRIIVIN